MTRLVNRILALALVSILIGGCASIAHSKDQSVYGPRLASIQSVTKLDGETLRIEYQPISETLYYSPGVRIDQNATEIRLKILRRSIQSDPALTSTQNLLEAKREGTNLVVELKNPSGKEVYLIDAEGRPHRIWSRQASAGDGPR